MKCVVLVTFTALVAVSLIIMLMAPGPGDMALPVGMAGATNHMVPVFQKIMNISARAAVVSALMLFIEIRKPAGYSAGFPIISGLSQKPQKKT